MSAETKFSYPSNALKKLNRRKPRTCLLCDYSGILYVRQSLSPKSAIAAVVGVLAALFSRPRVARTSDALMFSVLAPSAAFHNPAMLAETN